jgi:hypothetical protein
MQAEKASMSAPVHAVVMPQLCGCGKPVRYIVPSGDGTADSCNKYMRCHAWDELHEQNKELRGKLAQYETLMKLFKDLSA